MLVKAVEFAGFCLVVYFLGFIWPPLVLLGAGLVLILFANTRGARPARLGAVVGAAWSAGRRAVAASREVPDGNVRRIA